MFSVRILKKKGGWGAFYFLFISFQDGRHFLIIFQDGRHLKKLNMFSVRILKKGGGAFYFLFFIFQDGRHFKIIFQDGRHFWLASIPEVTRDTKHKK